MFLLSNKGRDTGCDKSLQHVAATGCCNKSPRVTCENHCRCDRILLLRSETKMTSSTTCFFNMFVVGFFLHCSSIYRHTLQSVHVFLPEYYGVSLFYCNPIKFAKQWQNQMSNINSLFNFIGLLFERYKSVFLFGHRIEDCG